MFAALTFVLVPRQLIGLFSDHACRAGGRHFATAAGGGVQLFDGLQGVITGTLRGLGDTRTPMIVNLVAHWLLGLPIGYVLCFVLGWGVYGLWVGLSLGLIVTGIILFWVWTRRIPSIRAFVIGRSRLLFSHCYLTSTISIAMRSGPSIIAARELPHGWISSRNFTPSLFKRATVWSRFAVLTAQ